MIFTCRNHKQKLRKVTKLENQSLYRESNSQDTFRGCKTDTRCASHNLQWRICFDLECDGFSMQIVQLSAKKHGKTLRSILVFIHSHIKTARKSCPSFGRRIHAVSQTFSALPTCPKLVILEYGS